MDVPEKNINGLGGRGATLKKYLESRKPISPYGLPLLLG
jgi:hypothetical protein